MPSKVKRCRRCGTELIRLWERGPWTCMACGGHTDPDPKPRTKKESDHA